MDLVALLPAFVLAVLLISASPGPAMALIFRHAALPRGRPLLATTALLAAAQVLIETAFYLTLAAAVGRAGSWFRRPTIRRRLEVVSGSVLIALGLRLATTAR